MSNETLTATDTASDLKLTPPDPVPVVAPERAAGLVPVTDEQTTKLQERVDSFVADLVAQDVNSPEFGKRVDQLTNMGRKEIMEAAGQSNRFLDRPIRQMDEQSGVGADLAEIPANIKEGLEIVPVAHVDEVLARALATAPEAIEWTEADDLASQPATPGAPQGTSPTAH